MLLKARALRSIQAGDVSLVYRRFRRPTVRAGGTLRTALGVLDIGRVDVVDPAAISEADARRAGYEDADALRADLADRAGEVFRIEVAFTGRADPRDALRARVPDDDGVADLVTRLAKKDARAASPWTTATLALIADQPGRRAGDLAKLRGVSRERFKADVRKLKALGLTESLAVGYRLSPRGEAVLRALKPSAEGAA